MSAHYLVQAFNVNGASPKIRATRENEETRTLPDAQGAWHVRVWASSPRTARTRAEAIHRLRDDYKLTPGDTIYTAAVACGFTYDKRKEALRAGGCGMDMGFHVVSTLSRVLYPDGFGCIGNGEHMGHASNDPVTFQCGWCGRTSQHTCARCPSNDHSNGDRDYTPHDVARERPCITCDGTGERIARKRHGLDAACSHCNARGTRAVGHWHKAGDYALRHAWL